MSPHTKVTFIKYLPSGAPKHDREAEKTKVRFHAAQIGHQRIRSKPTFVRIGPSERALSRGTGKTLVPFRLHSRWLSRSSPDLLNEPSENLSTIGSSGIDGPSHLSQPLKAINIYWAPEQKHRSCHRHREPDVDQIRGKSLMQTQPPSDYREKSPFRISIFQEGFSGLRTDPFSCIPGMESYQARSTIDFYQQVISTGNDTVCYLFDVSNVYASFLESLQYESFVDAGYSVIQFLKEQAHTPGAPPSSLTLKHKGKAIRNIRNLLATVSVKAIDDMTIFAMIFLAALDRALQNLEEHDIHKKNIALIVAQQGGLRTLQDGSTVKGYLMHYDTFWAMETGETMFPGERRPHDPVYPAYPFSPALNAFAATLPSGFQKLVFECVLSNDLLPILSRAVRITRLSDRGRYELLAKTKRTPKEYNDFWEASPCLSILDDSDPIFDTLLSLTLVCYSFIAFESRSHPTCLRGARSRATRSIPLYTPRSEAERKCLIWMWVVVIDSWRMGPRLQEGGVSSLCAFQTRFPEYRHVDAVVELGDQFLWTRYLTSSVYLYWNV